MPEKEYIERKKLNDMLGVFCMSESLYEVLQTIPTSDVQPVKHGHWCDRYRSGAPAGNGVVSSCCDMWNERKTDFCPNCGARMKKNITDMLCWDCKRLDCVWMKNLKPVPGWTAERHIKEFGGKELATYCVKECPEFRR